MNDLAYLEGREPVVGSVKATVTKAESQRKHNRQNTTEFNLVPRFLSLPPIEKAPWGRVCAEINYFTVILRYLEPILFFTI